MKKKKRLSFEKEKELLKKLEMFLTRKLINLKKIDYIIEAFIKNKRFDQIINLFQDVFGIQDRY